MLGCAGFNYSSFERSQDSYILILLFGIHVSGMWNSLWVGQGEKQGK